MTWAEAGWATFVFVAFVWGANWRDRAHRLQHERDIYRRLARARHPRVARGMDRVLYDQDQS